MIGQLGIIWAYIGGLEADCVIQELKPCFSAFWKRVVKSGFTIF